MSEKTKVEQNIAEKSDASKKSSGKKWGIIGAIAVVLIAIIVGVSIYNTPANRIVRQLDLGNKYLEEQNYEQAVVEFDKAIAIDPMSVEAYLGKAQAYEGMGDIEKAMQTLEEGYDRTGDERLLEMMQILDPVIEWEDAAFEALIREYLGKPEGDIRESDVCDIENIEIWGIYMDENITSGTITYNGHDLLANKRSEFSFGVTSHGNIETLNDLKYFTAIKYLAVGCNNISDISVLESLTNLEYLDLHDNNISDISVLGALTNLKELYLSNNNISDISVLGGLANLALLDLTYNNISDISVLGALTNLKELYLYNNNISDISVLGGLANLALLQLAYNNISDISVLGGLTNLTHLVLHDNNISDISVLDSLTNLKELYLSSNNISDISVLGGLANLALLDLGYNNISDISVLEGLTNLTWLSLSNNPITDYSPVSFVETLYY